MISDVLQEWLDTVVFTDLGPDVEMQDGLPVLQPEPDDPDDAIGDD